jgi:hypothetical protein
MVGVVALVTGKVGYGTILFTPVTVIASMDTGIPVTIGHPVTFPAEPGRLIFGNHTAIMIGICIRIVAVMTIETPEIQPVGKKHILVGTEWEVRFFRF